jgi:hypothetical protein
VPLAELEPGLPPDLLAVVDKALTADAAGRYPSAFELADDLKRFAGGQLVGARDYSPGAHVMRFVARHPLAVGAAVAAVAAALLRPPLGSNLARQGATCSLLAHGQPDFPAAAERSIACNALWACLQSTPTNHPRLATGCCASASSTATASSRNGWSAARPRSPSAHRRARRSSCRGTTSRNAGALFEERGGRRFPAPRATDVSAHREDAGWRRRRL